MPINNDSSGNCTGIVDWVKFTNLVPINIPEWTSGVLWRVTTNATNYNTTSNPSIYQVVSNPIYSQQAAFSPYLNTWLKFDFGQPFKVQKVALTPYQNTTVDSESMDFQYSVDDNTWINLLTNVATIPEYVIPNSVFARYFRIINRDNNISSLWYLNNVRIFGNY